MLTDADAAWIHANRTEIKQHRTEPVTVEYVDGTLLAVDAIWKEPPTPNGGIARNVGDYTLDSSDYVVTFDANTDATGIIRVIRKGLRYIITDVDERGLGGLNRYECRAMLAVTDGLHISVIKSGVDDGWGVPAELPPVIYPAFVSEDAQKVANQYGEETSVQLRIVLEGLVDVTYRDKVRYENELGAVVERVPVRIVIKRRVDGTPLITEVYV
jgi:hypothetical protein